MVRLVAFAFLVVSGSAQAAELGGSCNPAGALTPQPASQQQPPVDALPFLITVDGLRLPATDTDPTLSHTTSCPATS